MKYLKLLISLVLTGAIFYGLDSKFGSIPPLGKFLNPYNGIWQNETDESIEGELIIEGLADEVIVHYDEALIPHVFAQNDKDLYRAQGYITAKHRLWQLEFQTYAAAGRLSEIVGEAAIEYDKRERRRGMGYGAEMAIEKMKSDPVTYNLVESYAAGVNSYINSLDPKDYPVEYKLLNYKPEPWTINKTALLLMYMTKMLAGGDDDLEYTNTLQLLGKENFDFLLPDFFDITDPVIPKETDWSYIDVPQTPTPFSELPQDTIAFKIAEKPHPDNGSNNWAVSGSKSYSGNPILANDPHLGLNLPSIWFVMQLSTPDHNSFGATLPGALGVISGFNEYIAWGETNATRDVLDWYKIEFNEDRSMYRHDGQWKPVTIRTETIKVKGGETVTDSVLYTHHGPVMYDINFMDDNPRSGYAMKWTGHMGGNNQKTFIELNKGKNYEDYVNALKNYVAPAQNFVFASTEGDIALWIQGLLPNKWEGQGKFLLDGSNPEHDWQGFIPQEFNAHTKNPERGFVSSANQHPVDEAYPYYVFNDGYETYRNRVINDFFNSKDSFDIQDFKELHNNNFNLKASELVPYMLEHMNKDGFNENEQRVFNEMSNWKFNNDLDEVGPSIWRSWWYNLYQMVWDELDSEDIALSKPYDYQTIYALTKFPEHDFMDIVETTDTKETAHDLFRLSFEKAVVNLMEWQEKNGAYNWNNYKGTYAGHLLQGLPAFSRFDIPIGGDRSIVNATSKNHGPSWRMIVEMTSPPTALGIYPGGQSGNPGSKYYDNFISDWAAGEYLELNFMPSASNATGTISTQTLKPLQ
ncbi:penicillin acylase family protein [Winogradskyella aurantiaca]|uniref:penicillin acylase family protein n=1 Tax=Winogradskyella aurantiaca TaxID=2219558 RepID=UPI000E1CD97A|nr:penicillin acylase family protein [Winogradskyella aurantiaca]